MPNRKSPKKLTNGFLLFNVLSIFQMRVDHFEIKLVRVSLFGLLSQRLHLGLFALMVQSAFLVVFLLFEESHRATRSRLRTLPMHLGRFGPFRPRRHDAGLRGWSTRLMESPPRDQIEIRLKERSDPRMYYVCFAAAGRLLI